MLIQFSLQDLLIFLLCALGITAGILLVSTLFKVKKAASTLRSLLEVNTDSINKTIKTMPGIFENMGQISSDVRYATEEFKVSVPVILGDIEGITNTAKGSTVMIGDLMTDIGSGINETKAAFKKNTPAVMGVFHLIEEIAQIISSILSFRK